MRHEKLAYCVLRIANCVLRARALGQVYEGGLRRLLRAGTSRAPIERFDAAAVFLKWRRLRGVVTVSGVSAQVFRYVHRVTYADCTLGNHIYYSRYLDLLEAARNEFFRQLGTTLFELQEQDTIFPVVECHVRYKSPARYDEVLTIELRPVLVQGARLNFGCRILKDKNVVVLEGETFHVCTGLNEKPKRVPQELAEKLGKFLTADGRR